MNERREQKRGWLRLGLRALKFNIVGWMGMPVNMGMLYLLKDVAGFPLILASVIAIETAIVHNYIWHRHWTWAHRNRGERPPFFKQLIAYNVATGLVDLVVNVSVLWVLTTFFGVYYLISNAAGMILGPLIKFWLNEKVIFRKKSKMKTAPQQEHS